MVQVHQLDPYKVQEIRVLEALPQSEQARRTLEDVARQVQPILRRRKFTVPLLKEFFPRNARLLGLNVGGGGGGTREICVRLRPAGAQSTFLPYESVLGTMLHEITHNVVSPHNGDFYKLLDELTQECEELMAKGISGTGAGFDAPAAGKAGGAFVGRAGDVPAHRLRELAVKAAEARLRKQAVMPQGPRTTGGDMSLRHLPPREAAAAAAERRLRDNKWCPTEALGEEAAAGHDVDAALAAILDRANGGAGAGAAPAAAAARGGQRQQQHEQQQQQHEQQHEQQQHQQQQHQQHTQQHDGQPAAQAEQAGGTGAGPAPAGGRLSLRERVAQHLGRQASGGAAAQGAAAQGAAATSAGAAAEAPAVPGLRSTAALGASGPAAACAVQHTAAGATPQAAGQSPPPPQQTRQAAAQAGVVDLTLSSDDEAGAGGEGDGGTAARPPPHRMAGGGGAAPQASKRASRPWACPACTLLNRPLALACDACLAERPAGWAT